MPRGVRRVRDAQNEVIKAVQTYGTRRLLLALESGLPSEVLWALNALLVASSDGMDPPSVAPQAFRLETIVSISRNPSLLRALLPLALPVDLGPLRAGGGKADGLGDDSTTAADFARMQHRQAWLLLRNMSLAPENEQMVSLLVPVARCWRRSMAPWPFIFVVVCRLEIFCTLHPPTHRRVSPLPRAGPFYPSPPAGPLPAAVRVSVSRPRRAAAARRR